ncbi:MAG: glycosyltransferase family 39 protein [Anaerolineae bacterium]|nr:glycosyltransferase family 39 protein [Anaerolineae bacterium]
MRMNQPDAMLKRSALLHEAWFWLILITLVGGTLRVVSLRSIPPGLHYDEAVYGLQALDIYHGQRPVFFSSYTGREPLYMYLIAAMFRLVGIGALGIRLTSALAGTITIPLVFLAVRELLAERPEATRVGLLAAAYVAFSYWHLTVSRNGYPNILIPPLECLAIYGLWRGYREGHLLPLTLGGFCTGLILYTYLAARFFPLTVVLSFLWLALVDRRRFLSGLGKRFWGLALAAIIAGTVFAPLGLYFVRHPEDFWERANQVLVFRRAAPQQALWILMRNMARTLGGLFWRGDPRNHFNLPGKPILSPVSTALFGVGLIASVVRWRRPPYLLFPIWVLGMSLPAVLTEAQMPQGQRMFGIVPAVYGLVALGLDECLRWTKTRFERLAHGVLPAAVALLLVFEGTMTAQTYFGLWAKRQQTFYSTHADYALVATEAGKALEADQQAVILSREYKHPGVVLADLRTLSAIWVSGGRNLVIPHRPGQEILYLWPMHSNPLDEAIRTVLLSATEPLRELPDPAGETALRVARLRDELRQNVIALPARAVFADEVEVLDWRLLAAEGDLSLARDEPVRLLVRWRVKSRGEGEALTLHLMGEEGILWAQDQSMGYFAEQWQPGDTVYQVFELDLPPGIPAGPYELALLLSRGDGSLLPVALGGRLSGVNLSLERITLTPEGAYIQSPDIAGMAWGSELRIIESESVDRSERLGGALQLAITWQAQVRPTRDWRVAFELLNAEGEPVTRFEHPVAYPYATSLWREGEVVRAIYRLPLAGLDPGRYLVRLSGVDLEEHLALGQVHIEGGERTFQVPDIEHPLSARFGREIELLGFDLASQSYRSGEVLRLEAYWRAASRPAGDYKVFVHLVGNDGNIYAQHDAAPANWQRPTPGWEAGEVIVDEHALALDGTLPAGEYQLYLGMYDAQTLQRLPTELADGQVMEDARVLLTTITITH